MNKIQKALEALRTMEDASADAPVEHPLGQTLPRGVRAPTVAGPTGVLPGHSIKVDASHLVESGLVADRESAEAISNQFRRAKRPILQLAFDSDYSVEDNSNVIMVASALPGAGKSFCSFNLALSIAIERDVGAVLVDADVLKPGISRTLGLEDRVGLIDYLIDPDIALEDVLVTTNLQDIVVLPAGRRHPEATELLASRRMKELMALLSKTFESRAIVVDTPPLLMTNEAQVIAERAGQIVLVVEARKSSQDSVSRALGMLDRTKPINAILNKSRSAASDAYHGESYRYGYHYYARESGAHVKQD